MTDLFKEVKRQVEIVEVLKSYGVELKRVGSSLRALCPIHKEKTPSFFVNDNQGFICRGCGAKGDVIEFKSIMDNLSPFNAAKALASEYNLSFKCLEKSKKNSSHGALDKVAQYYSNFVSEGESVKTAISYIFERKLEDGVEPFQIVIAPDTFDSFKSYVTLRFPNIELDFWKKSNLLKESSKKKGYFYDALRSRLIFPIKNIDGDVVGFIGRAYDSSLPKYLIVNNNDKSPRNSWSYGFYESKKAGRSLRRIVLSEGALDCFSYFLLNEFSVSSLGTEVSPLLVKRIMKSTREVVLSFDPDKAGFKAIINFIEHASEYWTDNHSIRVVILPEGNDPDEIRRTEGLERLAEELTNAKNIFDWVVEYYNSLLEEDLQTAIKFLIKVDQSLNKMQCEILKNATKQYIKTKIGVQKTIVEV